MLHHKIDVNHEVVAKTSKEAFYESVIFRPLPYHIIEERRAASRRIGGSRDPLCVRCRSSESLSLNLSG
jgi:hypothetical protein